MIKDTVFKSKKIFVLGLAKSGTEAARLLLRLGAQVTVNDREPFESNPLARELESEGANVICGTHPLSLIDESYHYLIKNPGIRYDHPLIKKALALKIPVLTEVELAYHISEAEMIGITGSNGKTTTTTYIGKMLENSKRIPKLAGNIGLVASQVAQQVTSKDIMVVELSSFQLMGIKDFRPKISILLNLVEAHLDYHGSLDEYAQAKKRIFMNQEDDDFLIFNADDKLVRELVKDATCKKIPFSVQDFYENGGCLKKNKLMIFGRELITVSEMSLPGIHNVANGLAAALAASLAGAEDNQIIDVLKTFAGVEHRLQFVASHAGRAFYNNSKATNVQAAMTSLTAFEQPVHLIAGGLDRGLSFDELIPLFSKHVKSLTSYGETKNELAKTATKAGVKTVTVKDTLTEATQLAFENSSEDEVILLSPACASWDQFKTFEERGRAFTEKVHEIIHSENATSQSNYRHK